MSPSDSLHVGVRPTGAAIYRAASLRSALGPTPTEEISAVAWTGGLVGSGSGRITSSL